MAKFSALVDSIEKRILDRSTWYRGIELSHKPTGISVRYEYGRTRHDNVIVSLKLQSILFAARFIKELPHEVRRYDLINDSVFDFKTEYSGKASNILDGNLDEIK